MILNAEIGTQSRKAFLSQSRKGLSVAELWQTGRQGKHQLGEELRRVFPWRASETSVLV